MKDEEIKQLIQDKTNISQQIMRDINIIVQKLNEANESEFVGFDSGWDYHFKREKNLEKEDRN